MEVTKEFCDCLCAVVHPDTRGICRIEADTTVTFHSDVTGVVEVAMCQPCANQAVGLSPSERAV